MGIKALLDAFTIACRAYIISHSERLEAKIDNDENELTKIAADPTPDNLLRIAKLRSRIARRKRSLEQIGK